jgi:hypothetical protein
VRLRQFLIRHRPLQNFPRPSKLVPHTVQVAIGFGALAFLIRNMQFCIFCSVTTRHVIAKRIGDLAQLGKHLGDLAP